MDAANVDLKGFTEGFYFHQTGAHLAPVLETLEYINAETNCWLKITTLLIPGQNDSTAELDAMTRWIAEHLGRDVPLHFTAFHPDYKMTDVAATPASTLQRARKIGLANGLRYVYTGNVHDTAGGTTSCPGCDRPLIVRDWHAILRHELDDRGRCPHCGTAIAGRFGSPAPANGRRRFRCAWRHSGGAAAWPAPTPASPATPVCSLRCGPSPRCARRCSPGAGNGPAFARDETGACAAASPDPALPG